MPLRFREVYWVCGHRVVRSGHFLAYVLKAMVCHILQWLVKESWASRLWGRLRKV